MKPNRTNSHDSTSVCPSEPLPLLYRDDHLVVVSKPAGLLVHRGRGPNEQDALIQRLRDQIGLRVFPAHRLDRPTSGVIVLALDKETHRRLSAAFQEGSVTKTYLAVTRGFAPETGLLDYPLKDEEGRVKDAVTQWRRLATASFPHPVGRYLEARVSLVLIQPRTGRFHQIRKHFAHLRHPLIGDTRHGEGRWNRLFREHLACRHLLLHALQLTFEHPHLKQKMQIQAPLDDAWVTLLGRLGWSLNLTSLEQDDGDLFSDG